MKNWYRSLPNWFKLHLFFFFFYSSICIPIAGICIISKKQISLLSFKL